MQDVERAIAVLQEMLDDRETTDLVALVEAAEVELNAEHERANMKDPDRVRHRMRGFVNAAGALWRILDDISTLGDVCKDDDALYRRLTDALCDRRLVHGKSLDGQTITWAHYHDEQENDA